MINSNRLNRRDMCNTRRDTCGARKDTDMSCEKGDVRKLLRELQLVDFSMIDTILYLDAYPCCAEALDYYHKLHQERKKLHDMLTNSGYPITAQDSYGQGTWNWTDAPWPWEIEAN